MRMERIPPLVGPIRLNGRNRSGIPAVLLKGDLSPSRAGVLPIIEGADVLWVIVFTVSGVMPLPR